MYKKRGLFLMMCQKPFVYLSGRSGEQMDKYTTLHSTILFLIRIMKG